MSRESENLRALGAAIRKRRVRLGLSQEAVAEKAGLHPTYVSQLEAGRRNMSVLVLLRIARALGVHPGRLLRDS